MKCSKAQESLSAYLDGELSEQEAQDVQAHCARCEDCQEVLTAYKQVETLSREHLGHEPPEEYWTHFLSRLHQRIDEAPTRPLWPRIGERLHLILFPSSLWLKTAGAVASVLLIFIIGRSLIQTPGTREALLPPRGDIPAMKTKPDDRVGTATDMEAGAESEDSKMDYSIESKDKGMSRQRQDDPQSPGEEQEMRDADGFKTEKVRVSAEKSRSLAEGENLAELKKASPLPSVAEDLNRAVQDDGSHILYDQANEQQNVGLKEAAAAQYRQIIDDHPQSAVADDAQFQLNVMAQSESEETGNPDRWRTQLDAWQQFLKTYPESDLSDKACTQLAETWYQLALLTTADEDINNALKANRQCRQQWGDQEALQKQAVELERLLKGE